MPYCAPRNELACTKRMTLNNAAKAGRGEPGENRELTATVTTVRRGAVTAKDPYRRVATVGNRKHYARPGSEQQTERSWRGDRSRVSSTDRRYVVSIPPLCPQQQSSSPDHRSRAGESNGTTLAIRDDLGNDRTSRGSDMPGHRGRTRPGKVTLATEIRGTDHDEREQHNPRRYQPTDPPNQFHEPTTATPLARATNFSNCTGSVVNSPSRMVLFTP